MSRLPASFFSATLSHDPARPSLSQSVTIDRSGIEARCRSARSASLSESPYVDAMQGTSERQPRPQACLMVGWVQPQVYRSSSRPGSRRASFFARSCSALSCSRSPTQRSKPFGVGIYSRTYLFSSTTRMARYRPIACKTTACNRLGG
jgi:hypothetical protein